MAGDVGRLRMRCSSALLDDLGAREDGGAHLESSGGEHGVRGVSEVGRRRWRRWARRTTSELWDSSTTLNQHPSSG